MRAANRRGEDLGLDERELAFYDALEVDESAVAVLGDDVLAQIARDLVAAVKRDVRIDWTIRDDVRAGLPVAVKRILRKYDFPPDKQQAATDLVLKQAELFADDWADA